MVTTDELILAKSAQLDLLLELRRICEAYKIKYFLIGGSLLGAVRHKGFIPWDDDIDVGMLRCDYDKFIFKCKDNLDKCYMLDDWYSDANSANPYLKIRIKRTQFVESVAEQSNMNNGIFIDIFPFDNCPNSLLLRKIQAYKSLFYRRLITYKTQLKSFNKQMLVKRLIKKAVMYFIKFLDKNKLKLLAESNFKRYNRRKTEYVVNMTGEYSYESETINRSYLEKLIKLEFEGYDFFVPENYDEYLRQIYGDYMKLPPPNNRISKHRILKIDFGDYEIKSKIK